MRKGIVMKMVYFSFLFLACFQINANTHPTIINIAGLPYKQAEATLQQKEEIFRNLDTAIRSISNGAIILPKMITVYALKQHDNAFFYPRGNALVTPYQLNINGLKKHPKFTRGTELHEFGHSIFEENFPSIIRKNIKKDLDVYLAYLRNKHIYEREAAIFMGHKISLLFAQGTKDEPFAKVGLERAEANLDKVMDSEASNIEKGENVARGYLAYSEFFADVFAVVLTRDPDVVKDAIHFSTHTATDRSFHLRQSKRTLTTNAHNFLSLSRQYIYKYYLSHPEVRKKGNIWILKRTLESIRCVYEFRDDFQRNFYLDYGDVSKFERLYVEKSNENLNRCIDQEFNK